MTPTRRVAVAQIVGAHGVRGAVRLHSFTSKARACCCYGPVSLKDGRQFRVTYINHTGNKVRVWLNGVKSREQAYDLKGETLFVARTVLPKLDDEEAFYHADLIDLIAVREDDQPIGKVVALYNHGSCDLLEIDQIEGKKILLPFTRQFVPRIDSIAGRLTIVLPCEES